MTTEITLDLLTADSVTVETINIFENDGTVYRMPPHAKAYPNSEAGRAELQAEVSEPYLSAVLTIWGDAPATATETITATE